MLSVRKEMRSGRKKIFNGVKAEVTKLRNDVKEDAEIMTKRMSTVEEKMKIIEERLKVSKLEDMGTTLKKVVEKVEILEKSGASSSGASQEGKGRMKEGDAYDGDPRSCTMVIGGLKDKTLNDGIVWVQKNLSEAGAALPLDIFIKEKDSDIITNILFAKFRSQSDRDAAIKALKTVTEEVWMKPDMRLEDRAFNGFSFGMKYMLTQSRRYERWEVQVDVASGTMYVGEEQILEVTEEQKQLLISWSKE